MPALYLDAQGAYLRKDGGEYVVRHSGAELRFPAALRARTLGRGGRAERLPLAWVVSDADAGEQA